MARRWKELLCAFGHFTFRFPGLLLAPDPLPSDTLSSVEGYPPYAGTPCIGTTPHINTELVVATEELPEKVLLTTRCQFFLGAFPPLLAARTLAALARHLLLGREAYAKR